MLCEICSTRNLKTAWFPNALLENRFETWFQPVVNTSSREILGHECLIRLCDDSRGEKIRGGEEIVAAARARNQAQAFESRAIAVAIRSAAAHHRQFGGSAPGLFFVNLLPCSIADPEFSLQRAIEALAGSGLRPENFVFEAVDSDLADSARLRTVHDYLGKQGFGFALDNAGVGSNCLEMVRDLRPAYVKIDRSLVGNAKQPVCAATIRKLVELADRVGAQAVAVGVERPRTLENLWLLGVQAMQGYLFGRPARQIARSPMASAMGSDLASLARALDLAGASSPRGPTNPTGAWQEKNSEICDEQVGGDVW